MKYQVVSEGIFTVDNFFTAEECKTWIEKSEELGYEEAKITMGQQQVMMKRVRNNERRFYDNEELAVTLFEKAKAFIPEETTMGYAIGLNERFRFYKYFPGQQFRMHQDGSYIRNVREWSSYTFMIYLNEDYLGGHTKFLNCIVKGETGKLLIFKHQLAHEGTMVLKGVKYILRTDVMYRRKERK